MGIFIAPTSELRPEILQPLIDESLSQGFQFVDRLRREWDAGQNRFDQPGEALLLAWSDGIAVGVCGLNCDPYAMDPAVARLRHLFVRLTHRRFGVGRALTMATLGLARRRFRSLRLRTDSAAGAAFFGALGFSSVLGNAGFSHELMLVP